MGTRVEVTYTCDSCGVEAPRTEAHAWYHVGFGRDDEDQVRQLACTKRCARLLMIRACNDDLKDP